MPGNRNNPPPPEVMTWKKASLVLVICGVFDALRIFFEMFWFFGPALATVYCTSKVGGWVGSLGGLTAAACTAAGGVVGYFGYSVTTVFGSVMAMAVGLFGWLTIGLIILMTNSRIIKDNFLWLAGGLLISETPIIGALPGLTGTTVKMYSKQIKQDKEAMKKYEKEQADAQLQERNRQIAYLMQARAAQQEQVMQQEEQEEAESKEEETREAA